MAALDAVIFDIGNVFVEWDPRNMYADHFEDHREMEYFLANVTTPEWNLEQDRGRSFEDGIEILIGEFPHYAEKINLFQSHWPAMLGKEISGTIDVFDQLIEAGIPVYAITNFSAETWPIFTAHHAFTERFLDIIVSGRERLIKPDAAIYDLAIERFDIVPDRTIFIDDSIANIEGAMACKLKGHHFTDARSLKSDLKNYGLIE